MSINWLPIVIVNLFPFRYDNVPPEINRLRCRVNYHALKFLPEIEQMADQLASRMRNRTGSSNPYMYEKWVAESWLDLNLWIYDFCSINSKNILLNRALHLRFEKGMVGLSFCDFVGTREEKAQMAEYRKKEWPRRYKVTYGLLVSGPLRSPNTPYMSTCTHTNTHKREKKKTWIYEWFLILVIVMQNGSHLWQLALQKRKEGRCPLEPGEVAVILRAMGYPKETQIYVASGKVYGGQNRMAPLRNMFPNLVRLLIFSYSSFYGIWLK